MKKAIAPVPIYKEKQISFCVLFLHLKYNKINCIQRNKTI